jgi:hypothetical protein
MRFTQAIHDLSSLGPPTAFQFASERIPMSWIDEALAATGTASIRRRKLPAQQVVWLVIGMALFRDRSIHAVVERLGLANDDKPSGGGRGSVVPASVADARARLGEEPVRVLFKKTAQAWTAEATDRHRWRGLRVYALDGTTINVADTAANHEHFGRPGTSRGGPSAYPKTRLVALSATRSHLLSSVAIGANADSELTLAKTLLGDIPDESVTIVDRGFLAYHMLHELHDDERRRHWLTRAKKNLQWKTIKRFGSGDALVSLRISRESRRRAPSLPEELVVRAVRYQRRGFRQQWLLTSLVDPIAYPAPEIIELYHERWEIELAFDEKKTHMLEREETLRSKTPQGVRQELWGLAIAYNLVRLMMASVAEQAGVLPSRISFWNSLLLIRDFLLGAWYDAPGTLPSLLASMRSHMRLLVLPQRRPRSNPRQVKIKMSNYAKKPPLSHAKQRQAVTR